MTAGFEWPHPSSSTFLISKSLSTLLDDDGTFKQVFFVAAQGYALQFTVDTVTVNSYASYANRRDLPTYKNNRWVPF